MPHETPLITILVAGFGLAFIFGLLAQRLKMPLIAGYLLVSRRFFLYSLWAVIVVTVASEAITYQLAIVNQLYAAVAGGVGVEPFLPAAGVRHAQDIACARLRRHVGHHQQHPAAAVVATLGVALVHFGCQKDANSKIEPTNTAADA